MPGEDAGEETLRPELGLKQKINGQFQRTVKCNLGLSYAALNLDQWGAKAKLNNMSRIIVYYPCLHRFNVIIESVLVS